MLGAHFDSWHTGTGATDNAAGSAVMMEAMRILKATGVKLRRTVRIGLWTGEEQGLLGSRAYVKAHFGDPATMQLKPEHAKFSGYFNVDNGTGAIRGVYLQGNEAVAPIFQAWMEPFRNMGMTTLTIRNTGGTDHLSFDAVGLPGFQFIQDEVEYNARTHHSNMDMYERDSGQRHDAQRGDRRVVRDERRQPRREAAAQAPAEAPAAGAGGGTRWHARKRRLITVEIVQGSEGGGIAEWQDCRIEELIGRLQRIGFFMLVSKVSIANYRRDCHFLPSCHSAILQFAILSSAL